MGEQEKITQVHQERLPHGATRCAVPYRRAKTKRERTGSRPTASPLLPKQGGHTSVMREVEFLRLRSGKMVSAAPEGGITVGQTHCDVQLLEVWPLRNRQQSVDAYSVVSYRVDWYP